jgi:plasmid maintenance system antidote protein VapI
MQVIVNKINSNGKPLFAKEAARQQEYAGNLKVQENRINKLGRVCITAALISAIDSNASILLELHDAVLLWADDRKMRMRGFERDQDGTEYGQTWEIRFV